MENLCAALKLCGASQTRQGCSLCCGGSTGLMPPSWLVSLHSLPFTGWYATQILDILQCLLTHKLRAVNHGKASGNSAFVNSNRLGAYEMTERGIDSNAVSRIDKGCYRL